MSSGALAKSTEENFDLGLTFDLASSALAESRALQQRIDRKYLVAAHRLEPLLRQLQPEHLLLLASEASWAHYESVYFDSAQLDFYHAHRRGRMPRHKVRIRHHLDRQLTFLEVKRKESGGRTTKFRLSLPFGRTDIGAQDRRFVEQHAACDAARLVPVLTISFLRLTVLGRSVNERLTLDKDLVILAGGRRTQVPPVVIVEVKQSQFGNRTPAIHALRAVHARQIAVSKYCLGTLLSEQAESPVFRPILRALERLSV
jgi:VTC domain